jgi:hypothetical protein
MNILMLMLKCLGKMTANGLGLCEGRASEYQSFNLAHSSIEIQKFSFALMPFFHKTLVIGCFYLQIKFKKYDTTKNRKINTIHK